MTRMSSPRALALRIGAVALLLIVALIGLLVREGAPRNPGARDGWVGGRKSEDMAAGWWCILAASAIVFKIPLMLEIALWLRGGVGGV